MEDGIKLSINKDGIATVYEEPFTTIECQTEEDYNRLSELLEKGKNAEKIAMKDSKFITIPTQQFKIMEKECEKLDALENYGVINWDGYEIAMNTIE